MRNKWFNSITPLLAVAFTACTVAGCGGSPLKPSEINSYDGWWTAKTQKTPPRQRQSNWSFGCANLEGEFSFEVIDGLVRMNLLGAEQEQILSASGRFSIKQ